jgi:hypothetical protein
MRKILVFTVVAWLLLSGAAAFARQQGTTDLSLRHIAPVFLQVDGTPCAVPCFFGIVPGRTTLFEAQRLMTRHPAVRGKFRRINIDGTGEDFASEHYRMRITAYNHIEIAWISLSGPQVGQPLPQSLYTLGGLVREVGQPAAIRPVQDFTNYFLFFHDAHLRATILREARTRDIAASPRDAIESLMLYSSAGYKAMLRTYSGELRPWRGYTFMDRAEQGADLPSSWD